MISSLENGPTEEDLELLLGGKDGGEREEVFFVDLRGEPDDLHRTDYQEDSNRLNEEVDLKKTASQQGIDKLLGRLKRHKATRPKKKVSKRKKKSKTKNDFDCISIDSDDFVVPDDEVIPPDWEYNFEEPIVCQNATFYNNVDNILTRKAENLNGNENEISRDGDLMNISATGRNAIKEEERFCDGMNGINFDKEYIDDKDNTVLIVENHLLNNELDDEDDLEQTNSMGDNLNSFLKQLTRDKVSEKLKTHEHELTAVKSCDLILEERISKLEILNVCIKVVQKALKEFERNAESHKRCESSFKLQNGEISCLLIVFKSIDIEFSNLCCYGNINNTCSNINTDTGADIMSSFYLIQSYLDLFYRNILNSLDNNVSSGRAREVNLDFLKELHSEMIAFLESKFEEISRFLGTSSQLNDLVLLLFLKILGLTLLVEHLLIRTIMIEKTQGGAPNLLLHERSSPTFFNKENLLNKGQVSKILRRVLKRMLDDLLDFTFKESLDDRGMSSLQYILVLTLFMNCKVSGDLIFTFISESYAKYKNSTFNVLLVHYYAMISYSNVIDFKFDVSKLFPRIIFDLKSKSSGKKEYLSHYYLLNEYLKSVSVYQLNNTSCGNKLESLLYCLSDSKFLYNINNESHQVNAFLALFSNFSSREPFQSNINGSKLRGIRDQLSVFEKKLKNILFLNSGKEGIDCLVEEITGTHLTSACTNERIDVLGLTEEIYTSLLGLLVNLVNNSKDLCMILKFIKSNFEFEKVEENISKTDITMHYITYNSLFSSLLEADSRNLDNLPVLSVYNSYSDENDQINNFLLTEMVLNDKGDSDGDFSERINLNRSYKLFIQTLLGSSKIGPHFEKEFHLEILHNIIALIDSFSQGNSNLDCLKYDHKLELKELLHFDNKFITNNNSNIYSLKTCELILHSNLISKFNSNALFAHFINTGTKFFNACGNNNTCEIINVDIKKNIFNENDELIRILKYFRIITEEILDIYIISIANLPNEEFGRACNDLVGGILSLISNLASLLFDHLCELDDSVVCNFLRYYFGLVSEKLFYHMKRFKDEKILEPFVFHSFRAFGEFIFRFAERFSGNAEMKLQAYSFMVVLYLIMFSVKHCELKSYYNDYLELERKIFENMKIPNIEILCISQMDNNKKVAGRLSDYDLMNYCFKKKICKKLNSLYHRLHDVGVIDDFWKVKVISILNYVELLSDTREENKHNFNQTPTILNFNDLIFELYFDYFTHHLDGEALQIINKKLITSSLNLYSSRNIFGLLLNIILRGIHEKDKANMEELNLNWNHVNNSIKGYINQVKDESLVNIWVNYDFMHMFMIPSSFSCKFINIRIQFWTNILSIPLSKVLLNPNQDFLKVKTTLEFPLSYLKKLLLFKDFDLVRENLLEFSINFVIDSTRLIHLSYFKLILKMFMAKVHNSSDSSSLEFQELTQFIFKLLTYMTLVSQKLAIEIEQDMNSVSSAFKVYKNIKFDILDNISLLTSYLHEVSKTVHEMLTSNQQFTQDDYETHLSSSGHEMLRKKTEWINHFIYYSSRSDHSENQAKFSILEYIFKINDDRSLSTELQKLPQIFNHIKRKTSSQITHKSPFCTHFPASQSCSFSKVSLQLFEDICICPKLKKSL